MLFWFIVIIAASYVIAKACDSFEGAADYLGRNMPPGTKGTTINAIGSSLPELLTTLAFMFFIGKQGALEAGIATTAGSAVFNSVVIPALCIWVVGKNAKITLDKKVILRDGLFLIGAEILLIMLLGLNQLTAIAGLALLVFYSIYIWYVLKKSGSVEDSDDDSDDEEVEQKHGFISQVLTFDFNALLFSGSNFTNKSAWIVLSCAVVVIAVACHFLAEATAHIATGLGIPLYLSAMIIAAAATSVPDTILSVKDALKGNVDDALSNALGSNIFDITVALGLPLFLYSLIYGVTSIVDNFDMQVLRAVLVGITAIVLGIFVKSTVVTRKTAYILFGLYAAWVGYLIYGVISH